MLIQRYQMYRFIRTRVDFLSSEKNTDFKENTNFFLDKYEFFYSNFLEKRIFRTDFFGQIQIFFMYSDHSLKAYFYLFPKWSYAAPKICNF